jgi:hypothetical protein
MGEAEEKDDVDCEELAHVVLHHLICVCVCMYVWQMTLYMYVYSRMYGG